jgi:predicted nucleotidyltransferase component of viral defense system
MNTEKSIRARLQNISRAYNIAFNVIIHRYIHERLLYRVAISEYAENLFLKGGNLLYAMQGLVVRPTKDIDLLAVDIESNKDLLKLIFTEICSVKYDNDFVWFNTDTITAQEITKEHKYNGIRLFFDAGFDTIKQKVQIDIGFGDVMVPSPQQLDYPVLLSEMDTPVLSAYSSETVIAEKFQAMIELAELNSRMKDFYDIYTIIKSGNYDKSILNDAIESTFKNRNTNFVENHSLFTKRFIEDKDRNKMWIAFLNKINRDSSLLFADVVETIIQELKPIWEKIN